LKEPERERNSLAAFAGESPARNRYTYLASKTKRLGSQPSRTPPVGYLAKDAKQPLTR